MYAAGDVRVEAVPDPSIVDPTDANVRVTSACLYGSDLWPYADLERSETRRPMRHQAIGLVGHDGTDVRSTEKGPADRLTGDVSINADAAPDATSTFTAASVLTPAARPTHPHGQMSFVTEGVGLCQRQGGPVEATRPGERVLFEPGANHGHGAAPNHSMVHIAMQQSDDSGSPVRWGEPVTDDQYGDGRSP